MAEFDPDAYLQKIGAGAPQGATGSFDPDAYLAKISTPAGPSIGTQAEAAIEGFGKAGTFGYLPQIQAATQPYVEKALDFVTGNHVADQPENQQSYVQRRDQFIDRGNKLNEAAPGSYIAGNVAGNLMTPIPGMGKIKAAGLIGKAAKATAGGLINGLISNPGDEAGKVDALQLSDRGASGTKQGLLAGTLETLLGGAGKAVNAVAQKAPELASVMSLKALGGQKREFTQLMNKNKLDEVADFVNKNKIIAPGSSPADAVDKSDAILDSAGKQIGAIYKKVQAKVNDEGFLSSLTPEQSAKIKESQASLSPTSLADKIMDSVKGSFRGKAGGKSATSAIENDVTPALAELGENPSVEDLLKTRGSIDDLIDWKNIPADMKPRMQALTQARTVIQKAIDDHIATLDNVVGGNDLAALKAANKQYSLASTVNQIAKKGDIAEKAKNTLGLPDLLLGGTAAGGGLLLGDDKHSKAENVASALALAALSKGARKYAPGVGAKVLPSVGTAAGKVGGLLDTANKYITPERIGRGMGLLQGK